MTRTELGSGSQYHVVEMKNHPDLVIKYPTTSYYLANRLIRNDLSVRGREELLVLNHYLPNFTVRTRQLNTSQKFGAPIYVQERVLDFRPLTHQSISSDRDMEILNQLMTGISSMYHKTGYLLDMFGFDNLSTLALKYLSQKDYWAMPNLNFCMGEDGNNRITITDFGLFQTWKSGN